jgi:hypothetical protein
MAVASRCVLIRAVDAKRVPCISLLGDSFEAAAASVGTTFVVGNLHLSAKRSVEGHEAWVIAVDGEALRTRTFRDPSGAVRELIAAVARNTLGICEPQANAGLEAVIKITAKVNQANCNVARTILNEQIAGYLEELKPPTHGELRRALVKYQRAQEHAGQSNGRNDAAKQALVMAVTDESLHGETLSAVRAAIARYGYRPQRILFELFQNAEDAAAQINVKDGAFRVEIGAKTVRTIHWGRPVNDLGLDPADGEAKGWSRDLVNMLRFNVSEKQDEEGVTGKFGLGFKSVHMIARDVRLASGLEVACRIHGGFYPLDWKEGGAVAAAAARDGRLATVLELSLDPDKGDEATCAINAFRQIVSTLPYFSDGLRRIELVEEGVVDAVFAAVETAIPGVEGVIAVCQTGAAKEGAIAFHLGPSARLIVRLGEKGPIAFDAALPRLWCLEPLEEKLNCGWILDGRDLEIDPGRTRLSGDQIARFHGYGDALRDRLCALHALTGEAWDAAAAAFGLSAGEAGRGAFWQTLSTLFLPDASCSVARLLHEDGRGIAGLMRDALIIATGLPAPYAAAVKGRDALCYPAGLLAQEELLRATASWLAGDALSGKLVSERVASQLRDFGIADPKPVTLSDLLKHECELEPQVDPVRAGRIGHLLERAQGRDQDYWPEERDLPLAAKDLTYRMENGDWRKAGLPPLGAEADDEERMLNAIAPPEWRPDSAYAAGPALCLLRFSARSSGANVQPHLVRTWLSQLEDIEAWRDGLRYVLHSSIAAQVARGCDRWLPKDVKEFCESALTANLSVDETQRLIELLYPKAVAEALSAYLISTPSITTTLPAVKLPIFLAHLHEWWTQDPYAPRALHDQWAYPTGLRPNALSFDGEHFDRVGWFTFFALALFRSIGRTDDQHHRGFIDAARDARWWEELAERDPVEQFEPWRRRLEEWSRSGPARLRYPQHCSQLTNLFMLARWLPEYVEALGALPELIEARETGVQISQVFNPGAAEHWQKMGLEGGPLGQAMGLGVHWLVRECCRQGLYTETQTRIVAPWCFAPISRVCDLLSELGYPIEVGADGAPELHALLDRHMEPGYSNFGGDLDLPLRFISHKDWRGDRDRLLGEDSRYDADDLMEHAK